MEEELKCCCGSNGVQELVQCQQCLKFQHALCIESNYDMAVYVCFRCQLRSVCPQFQVIEEVIAPFQLNLDKDKVSLLFELEESVFQQFKSPIEQLDLQLRSIVLNSTGYQIKWPDNGYVQLNHKTVLQFKKTNQSKKRKDRVANISFIVQKGTNYLNIESQDTLNYYVVGLFIVKRLSNQELLEKFNDDSISLQDCRLKCQEFFTLQHDIQTSQMQFQDKCPYSFIKIQIPARGENCEHFQCFDLQNYINLMSACISSNQWRCPICKKLALKPYIDSFYKYLLDQLQDDRIYYIDANLQLRCGDEKPQKRQREYSLDKAPTKQPEIIDLS